MSSIRFEPNRDGISKLFEKVGRQRGEQIQALNNRLRTDHAGASIEDLEEIVRAALDAEGLDYGPDTPAEWAAGIADDEDMDLTVTISS